MRLIGILLSPYVRRVAVSLNVLNISYDLDDVFVFAEADVVRRYNPLVRIPALVLDDGEKLVDSGAILDEIDQMAPPARRLVPVGGASRRSVLQAAAIALGCADKAQWAFYEDRVRPPEKVHGPWIAHNDQQVLGGFAHLERAAAEIAEGGWIARTPDLSQADITTSVAFTFAGLARPGLNLSSRFPALSRLTERCEAMPAFRDAPLPSSSRLAEVLSQPFVA